ncbi:MAG: SH3 domain-containing protein [Spirochaetales bacterium]|nr:SH3 domain-containing protein [Leptospiraceae bacterium]MCP5482019.1 SH3 domain-containing protein [Spirochaetales bacterium]MCP5486500.1 SH3 domain-containing protein [Spirochaetales bacterium]
MKASRVNRLVLMLIGVGGLWAAPQRQIYLVIAEAAPVSSGSGTDSEVIHTLCIGDQVELTGKSSNAMASVRYGPTYMFDSTGYVDARLLAPVSDFERVDSMGPVSWGNCIGDYCPQIRITDSGRAYAGDADRYRCDIGLPCPPQAVWDECFAEHIDDATAARCEEHGLLGFAGQVHSGHQLLVIRTATSINEILWLRQGRWEPAYCACDRTMCTQY